MKRQASIGMYYLYTIIVITILLGLVGCDTDLYDTHGTVTMVQQEEESCICEVYFNTLGDDLSWVWIPCHDTNKVGDRLNLIFSDPVQTNK